MRRRDKSLNKVKEFVEFSKDTPFGSKCYLYRDGLYCNPYCEAIWKYNNSISCALAVVRNNVV